MIADDLTGAAEAGVAFSRGGRSVVLVLGRQADRASSSDHRNADVLVIDTDTREAQPGPARVAVSAAMRDIGAGCIVLKKVDSLLRGNIADEVAAIRAASADRLVIVAPALPTLDRPTRNGVPYVAGRPLRDTDAWRGEAADAPHRLNDVVAGEAVELEDIRQERDSLAAKLSELGAADKAALCDAESDSDLRAIVRAGLAADRDVLWVGSAGLAQALAGELRPDECSARSVPPRTSGAQYVAILGSTSAVAHSQARALEAAGATWRQLPADDLIRSPEGLIGRISATIGDNLVVTVSGEVQHGQRHAVARGLAIATAAVAAAPPCLVLSGGATARAVLTHRGVNTLALTGEIEPGVVSCVPDDDSSTEVITKAGSFGDPLSLVRVLGAQRQSEVTP